MTDKTVTELIEEAGGVQRLADILGYSRVSIWSWERTTNQLPELAQLRLKEYRRKLARNRARANKRRRVH